MGKFEVERFKTQLKLAKCRLENMMKQHRNGSSGRRRDIANLLQQGNEERARVNVKYLVRDDYLMEAYEMLLSFCDDLIQSATLIAQEKTCDPELLGSAKSLIYACGRVEVPELSRISEQLAAKFGKDFVDVRSEQGKMTVDARLIFKLSIRHPDARIANRYMAAIAESYGVQWVPPPEEVLLDEPLQQQQLPLACPPIEYMSSPPPPYPHSMTPPMPLEKGVTTSNNGHPSQLPVPSSNPPSDVVSPPTGTNSADLQEFEELSRRFLALKGNDPFAKRQ